MPSSANRPAYAGIGSRETPADVLDLMRSAAKRFAGEGWVLRSGGSTGADSAFEAGALASHSAVDVSLVEVFLPWPGFNGHRSSLQRPTAQAYEIAAAIHPNWIRLTESARKLHARNIHQVLGPHIARSVGSVGSTADASRPSSFILCWTSDGAQRADQCSAKTGGTATAIRVASSRNIAVHNLQRPAVLSWISTLLEYESLVVEDFEAPSGLIGRG